METCSDLCQLQGHNWQMPVLSSIPEGAALWIRLAKFPGVLPTQWPGTVGEHAGCIWDFFSRQLWLENTLSPSLAVSFLELHDSPRLFWLDSPFFPPYPHRAQTCFGSDGSPSTPLLSLNTSLAYLTCLGICCLVDSNNILVLLICETWFTV